MEKNKNYINSFLVENYPIKGARQCSVELGMNYNIIKNRASNLKLKKIDNFKVDLNNKEFWYMLGFLWSDGYFDKGRVIITIVCEDAEEIKETILRTGNWKFNFYSREKYKTKDVNTFYIGSKIFNSFLNENNYKDKYGSNTIIDHLSSHESSIF